MIGIIIIDLRLLHQQYLIPGWPGDDLVDIAVYRLAKKVKYVIPSRRKAHWLLLGKAPKH